MKTKLTLTVRKSVITIASLIINQVGRDFLIPNHSKEGRYKKRICAKGIPSGQSISALQNTGTLG